MIVHKLPGLLLFLSMFITLEHHLLAQDKGVLTGLLQLNANAFIEDAAIGAANTPQYDRQLFGGESWLDLNYQLKGFDFGLRFDAFYNSNLLNPTGSYSDQGIGRWHIKKQIDDLHVAVGYLYDQIGSGLIFRSYEERPLLIDNALYGVSCKYEIGQHLLIKALGGKQKNLFDTYQSFIKGVSLEGFVTFGARNQFSLAPGVGLINKTWSDDQVEELINTVKTYTPKDSVGLYYNSWAYTFYNTLSLGAFSWYVETAFKDDDVYFDADGERNLFSGETTLGLFRSDPGSVYYSSASVGLKGVGMTLEYKRTKNFTFRADPFTTLNRGLMNFLPPMSRVNSFRLKSRYVPATQEISEQALQMEFRFALSKKWKLVQYFSNINSIGGALLYREFDTEILFKHSRAFQITMGIQSQQYNQEVFEGKSGVPIVKTVIPYFQVLKRLQKRKSIRFEAQYMSSQQDFGSWIFALIEYNLAPKWSFALSDMYNVDPKKTGALHYPRVDVVYNQKSNRFSLSFVKQVEGVVCAGGICRLEPAFSGVRFNLISTL